MTARRGPPGEGEGVEEMGVDGGVQRCLGIFAVPQKVGVVVWIESGGLGAWGSARQMAGRRSWRLKHDGQVGER